MTEKLKEGRFPQDGENSPVGRKAKVKVIAAFNTDFWEFHEMTGNDVGIDLKFELIENQEYRNNRVECQVKGRTKVTHLESGIITFTMEVKTINYALNSPYCFLLLLYDEESSYIYYLPIQEYFHNNLRERKKLRSQKTINIHISTDNTVSPNNEKILMNYARARY